MTTYDATTNETTVWIRETRGERKGLWKALFRFEGRVTRRDSHAA